MYEVNFLYDLFQGENITCWYNWWITLSVWDTDRVKVYRIGTPLGFSQGRGSQLECTFDLPNYTTNFRLCLTYLRHHYFWFNWRFTTDCLLPNSGEGLTANKREETITSRHHTSLQNAILFSYSRLFWYFKRIFE